jgi:hypothetical protein
MNVVDLNLAVYITASFCNVTTTHQYEQTLDNSRMSAARRYILGLNFRHIMLHNTLVECLNFTTVTMRRPC